MAYNNRASSATTGELTQTATSKNRSRLVSSAGALVIDAVGQWGAVIMNE